MSFASIAVSPARLRAGDVRQELPHTSAGTTLANRTRMITPARIVTIVATSMLISGCGGVDTSESAPEEVGEAQQALASDPALAATSGWCRNYYSWNGTLGRIYYPSNGGCSKSVYSPLVVIVHARGPAAFGESYDYRDYHYLQRHLARNGFISVSVEVGLQDEATAASIAWDFVEDFAWSKWSKRFYIDPSSVALIGHSRGGGAVRYLAQSLENDPVFNVKSVVGLASVDAGPELDGQRTEGYLQLYGTVDGDTSSGATFGYYDTAGDDGPQLDPVWNDDVVYKSVKLIEGANHRAYSDYGNSVVKDTVKGYVLSYLAAHNKGDVTWYEDYIRGDAIPGSWAEPVLSSYSDGFFRRVIDNFDDGAIANTTIGGALATFNATANVVSADFPHDTDALWTWGLPNGVVTWTIPAGKRNAQWLEWLSLRIAQLSGAPSNDLRIQIRNGGVWSPEVRLTEHGSIAQPTLMCYGQQGQACLEKEYALDNHMATIRVPLDEFGAHDDVDVVRIVFRGDSAIDTFLIDNLEFSEHILKP